MKILFSTDTIQRGGKERQLFILADQLLKKKVDVNIVSLRYSNENYIDEYRINRKRILTINEYNFFSMYKKFLSIIKEIKPDIIFCWDMKTAFFSFLLYRKLKFIFVNGSIQHGIRLFRFTHLFRSLIIWFSPYVVANSKAGLKANNLRPSSKNFILYNGVENKFTSKMDGEKLELERKILIPEYRKNIIIFISVANFVPYKDYFTVLGALSKIKSIYNFHYLIIGDGPLRPEIEKRIISLKLQDNVILLGRIENVKKYLRISDVFIHSSRGEGVSNAILEAMFTGLPVIATDVGGTQELAYAKSCSLFEYKNKNQLYNILRNINNRFKEFDPNEKEYQDHLNKFSVNTMVARFDEIINKIYE